MYFVRLLATCCLTLFMVSACKPIASADNEEVGLSISVLNYTDDPLGVVYVDGSWAGGMPSQSGGTKTAGGVGLPAKWHPGIKVKIEWQDDTLYQKDKDGLYTATVEVPQYTEKHPERFWVALFPNHLIKVFASSWSPGNPNFPEGLQAPAVLCRADPRCATKFY